MRIHILSGIHGEVKSVSCIQRGLSLVELLISIAIGLLIVIAMLALYSNMSSSGRELAKANLLIENGRSAIQLIHEDAQHAGFWASYVPPHDDVTFKGSLPTFTSNPLDPRQVPTAIPDPCLEFSTGGVPNWTPTHMANLIGIPLQTSDTIPGTCATVLPNRQANTDVLVVRHAETCEAGQPLTNGGMCPNTVGEVYFQASLCADLPAGSYPITLDNQSANFTQTQKDCLTPAPVRRFVSSIYYIREYAETVGDGTPTLMMSSFSGTAQQAAVPLIKGVEGFVVELGIDDISKSGAAVTLADLSAVITWANSLEKNTPTNRGDGIPDRFIRCTTATPCTAADLVNVVLVKIYVLARNLEPTPGHIDSKAYTLGSYPIAAANDHFQRHVFSTAVRVQNISARREMP